MTSGNTRLLRILGFVALIFIAFGQALHAGEVIFGPAAQEECHHHTEDSSRDCPAGHSCCHAHAPSMILVSGRTSLPDVPFRILRFSPADSIPPDGCLREIDYPPQLS